MSLSDDEGRQPQPNQDAESANPWGTIYIQGRAESIGSVEHARSTNWTPADEQAYLQRVKAKAFAMATSILDEARREASRIREKAHEEGFQEGIANAQQEIDTFRQNMANATGAILQAIEDESLRVLDTWREDITAVARLAVEKISCLTLDENKKQMLETLLIESLRTLDKHRELTICVHPDDEAPMADVIALTKDTYAANSHWRIKTDPTLSPGSLVLESEYSLAASRVESRRAAVDTILSHLIIPDDHEPQS